MLYKQLPRPQYFLGETDEASAFPTDRAKVVFIISHLTGRAEALATAEWSRRSAACSTFTAALEQVFQHTTPGREATRSLPKLRHGILITQLIFTLWHPRATGIRQRSFFPGLSETVKDQLMAVIFQRIWTLSHCLGYEG